MSNQSSFNHNGDIENILTSIRGVINGNSPNTEVFELTDKIQISPVDEQEKDVSQKKSFSAGKTVEDIVIDLLKPQLKAWLNDNLPSIVNTMVQKEIKKIIANDE